MRLGLFLLLVVSTWTVASFAVPYIARQYQSCAVIDEPRP